MSNISVACAQTMSNDNYILEMEDVNIDTDTIEKTVPETKPTTQNFGKMTLEGVNYKVEAGFEEIPINTTPFSIQLSSELIDFGVLSPTNPIIRTLNLRINNQAVRGYSVLTYENEALNATSSANKMIIPDTTCDNGRCDSQTGAEWSNALTYGLGYRCDNSIGSDCDKTFVNPNYYKHFSNFSNGEEIQPIMNGIGSKSKEARISYKVNISGTQEKTNYGNVITYIAVPNY